MYMFGMYILCILNLNKIFRRNEAALYTLIQAVSKIYLSKRGRCQKCINFVH